MITWSQRILNETLHSVLDRPRVSGRFYEIDSSSIDEGASRIHIIFKEVGFTSGVWNASASLPFDKWVRAHQTVLESDEFKSSVAGMWEDIQGNGDVSTRESGDMTIELEPWYRAGTYRLSIQSRNPASTSPDDYTAEGESIKRLLSDALYSVHDLRSHDFKIGMTRLDQDGSLCISVRSEARGAGRYQATVVVTDEFKPDEAAQTFIEQNKERLESHHVAEWYLKAQLLQVLAGGSGVSEMMQWNPLPTTVKVVSRDGSKTDLEIVVTPKPSE
ncbi:hypothetical protein EHS25_008205 [Saitozyma podzolica]|uniref:Uncharacterized protein n=1 Tax=Saitozyma podzolica TaxID=1890683 RepID=A0A427YNX7_9TREE|nr:hypothetical protein EHS25_008205 [Saitozyma podzolica]